ncbi:MAG: carboxypeptidase M32 [Candidatus Hydrogenedentes bacterium]|nr:carboxypeptidase M32 [Candidatus Hydrogenedentota bacterium]
MTMRISLLRERLGEIADINSAIALLQWDQEVYMPPKAAHGRGQQLATLSALAHRLFTSAEIGEILSALSNSLSILEHADACLVEVVLHDFDRATKLPESFVHEFAKTQSEAYEVWVHARKESNFSLFEPLLARIVELNRRKADLLGFKESPYDALLNEFERGMTTARVKSIFGELAPKQSALVERIMASPRQPDVKWLDQVWPTQAQWDFSEKVLRDIGYDFDAGRQDKSVHPFTTQFDVTDVRITTRLSENDLFSALMGSIHEGGHALYTQGHDPADRRTPLLDGASLGLHESQSRMWENMIGRSLPFWRHYLPVFQSYFPGQLENVTAEQVYAAINQVCPSLIRVEADECTYNLHIILRFEIEVGLIEGALDVADVPEIWNAKMKQFLGLDVPNDAQGCLQDIHWSHGAFGYFPTYALGNLYAAHLFEAILRDIPDLWGRVDSGDFMPLLEWLREKVHRHGRRMLAEDIVQKATGSKPDSSAYLRYIGSKYSDLYGLE